MRKSQGFTLVELAIVLVIIGLIVGGVLVGQDLIKAAQIRSVVTDIERYNAATNTFRGKYNGLPGDLKNTKATQFGFNTADNDAARDGTPFHGDGNGQIMGCTQAPWIQVGCEAGLFWSDLSKAGLVGFKSKLTSTNAVGVPTGIIGDFTNAELGDGIIPKTKLHDNILVAIGHGEIYGDKNIFWLADFEYISGLYVNYMGPDPIGLTPLEAVALDTKLDDGAPTTGIMFVYPSSGLPDVGPTACITASQHYNTVTDVLGSTPVCPLALFTSF